MSIIKTSSTSKWATTTIFEQFVLLFQKALLLFQNEDWGKQCQTRYVIHICVSRSKNSYHLTDKIAHAKKKQKKRDKMTDLYSDIFCFSWTWCHSRLYLINFIRKELPEATVISRRTQIIKRTPFDIPRRRDDYKMNYAELQLWLSCVHGRYDQNMRHATKSQNVNEVFLRPENVACMESWNLSSSSRHVHQTTVAKISPFLRIHTFSAYFFRIV